MTWTWPWQRRSSERPSSFMVELVEIEQDCMRRLDYADVQIDRALRSRGSNWTPAMTVVDADIMPVGHATRIMNALHIPPRWRRVAWIVAALLAVAGILVPVIRCG